MTVSYRGRVPSLPGVTITRAGGGTARGYLTAAGAAAFGAALARQFIADHARGSYGQDGMFAGGVSVRLAGVPATAQPATAFPMHTLTVTGTNLAGKPDTGDQVMIFNADNAPGSPTRSSQRTSSTTASRNSACRRALLGDRASSTSPKNGVSSSATCDPAAVHRLGETRPCTWTSGPPTARSEVKTPRPAVAVNRPVELRPSRRRRARGLDRGCSAATSRCSINPTTGEPTVGTLQEYVFEQLCLAGQGAGHALRIRPGLRGHQRAHPAAAPRGAPGQPGHRARPLLLRREHHRLGVDGSGVFAVQWKTVPGVLFLRSADAAASRRST